MDVSLSLTVEEKSLRKDKYCQGKTPHYRNISAKNSYPNLEGAPEPRVLPSYHPVPLYILQIDRKKERKRHKDVEERMQIGRVP